MPYDPEKVVESVGRRVRELRLSRGWTQNDLAMRLRSAVQRVQNIERGTENLTLHSLARLANAFDTSLETLLVPTSQDEPGPKRGRPAQRDVAKQRPEREAPSYAKSATAPVLAVAERTKQAGGRRKAASAKRRRGTGR